MSDGSPAGLRTVAFGDLETGLWGSALASAAIGDTSAAIGDAVAAIASLESGQPLSAARARLEGEGPGANWALSGTNLSLGLTPYESSEPAAAALATDGFAQLCRVSGSAVLDGTEREIDCLGLRTYTTGLDLRSLDSVRQVLAWFAPDDGIALCSRRPRGAKGHDRDAVAATVLQPDGPVLVADGRLSTTYSESGLPARVGLELWLTEEQEQFPRRVSGEALGFDTDGQATGLAVGLQAFLCHSRGRDGAGAYLLVRPR